MSNITDFIKAAVHDQPQEAADAFDSIVTDKVNSAIAKSSSEYTKQMFNTTPQEDEE